MSLLALLGVVSSQGDSSDLGDITIPPQSDITFTGWSTTWVYKYAGLIFENFIALDNSISFDGLDSPNAGGFITTVTRTGGGDRLLYTLELSLVVRTSVGTDYSLSLGSTGNIGGLTSLGLPLGILSSSGSISGLNGIPTSVFMRITISYGDRSVFRSFNTPLVTLR